MILLALFIVLVGTARCHLERIEETKLLSIPRIHHAGAGLIVLQGEECKQSLGLATQHYGIRKKDPYLIRSYLKERRSVPKAPFIKPCHSTDTACLISSAQIAVPIIASGVPSLNMKPLDPMEVSDVHANNVGLSIHFTDTRVLGLRHCIVLDLERKDDNTTISLKCSVALKGTYTLGGKLLIMDITGTGPYTILIHDIVVKVEFKVGQRSYQGERYWRVISWKHSADVLGGVRYHFHNLFNGDTILANKVLNYANQNWHVIFQEVSPPIVKTIVAQIVAETSKLFNQVSINQLSLDD